MDYDEYVDALSELLVVPAANADFVAILPRIIADAEGRIYREMDFLAAREVNTSLNFTSGNREFTLPSGTLIVQKIAAISPAGSTVANGTRNPIQMVALDVLDAIWPDSGSSQGIPQYGAVVDDTTMVVAPTPAAAYLAEVSRIYRPDALSSSNTETYITLTYPDLMIAASMVFAAGYQRNFGAQADDPKMATSWESVYQQRAQSAFAEEQRRKGASTGWSPYQPAPLATPQRS